MGGPGVYKYLQIFLVLVDVVELEDVRVLDELQDGDLPLHLGGRGVVVTVMVSGTEVRKASLPPTLFPKGLPPLKYTHTHLHQHRF